MLVFFNPKTYHLVLFDVCMCERISKIIFSDHHNQHFEEACPWAIKDVLIFCEHDKQNQAKSNEGSDVNKEELDQLVDDLRRQIIPIMKNLYGHVGVHSYGGDSAKHQGHLKPGQEQSDGWGEHKRLLSKPAMNSSHPCVSQNVTQTK